MHETMVAQSLIEAIAQEAQKQQAKPIRAKMSCGQLNAVNDEVLSFAFDAVAAGTPCEGMTLEIEHKPLQAKCGACDRTFVVTPAEARCPSCRSDDFALLPDAPILLETVEFERAVHDGEG